MDRAAPLPPSPADAKIAALEARLVILENLMGLASACVRCGTRLHPGVSFCGECGQSLATLSDRAYSIFGYGRCKGCTSTTTELWRRTLEGKEYCGPCLKRGAGMEEIDAMLERLGTTRDVSQADPKLPHPAGSAVRDVSQEQIHK